MEADLITVPQLLQFMPSLADVDSVVLSAYVRVASNVVRKFCNRDFWYGSFVERVYYGPLLTSKLFGGSQINLYLKNYPVDYITNIEVDTFSTDYQTAGQCGGSAAFDNATNMHETTVSWNVPFVVQKSNGFVQVMPAAGSYPSCVNQPRQFIVNYNAGYQEIPSDVQMATAMIVKQQYEYNSQPMLMKSERVGDYSYSRSDFAADQSGLSIPQGSIVKQLLLPYQRRGVNGL